MNNIIIDPGCKDALKTFVTPKTLGFAKHQCPIMIEADYEDGKWSEFKLTPYRTLSIDPSCKILHYAQEIFEGLKAYYVGGTGPFLFRPQENAKRFNLSAQRMAMPEIDEEMFVKSCEVITDAVKEFIPTGSGDSLYLRPFMFATENSMGIKASNSYKFLVIASPCGSYFDKPGINVYVEKTKHRAYPGGTGYAKTGGNYAASLVGNIKAYEHKCDQVLWLNGKDKTSIEELSGMNFFAVINSTLVTPHVNDTVLNGITRDSILKIAKRLGVQISETSISIDDLFVAIKNGECTECFATGTAAIITPILHFVSDNDSCSLGDIAGPITNTLKACLLDIQEGRSDDIFGWRREVLASFPLIFNVNDSIEMAPLQ